MDTKAYIARASYGRRVDQPWKAGLMFGQSAIVHPDGTVLANAGHYEGVTLAHIEVLSLAAPALRRVSGRTRASLSARRSASRCLRRIDLHAQ